MKDKKNKVVLITGGAEGIGKATVLKFIKNSKVIVIDKDQEACKELKNKYPDIEVYNNDITDLDKIREIINIIFKKYNNIDVLINNAAIQTTCNLMDIDIEDWNNVINVNLNGTFIISQSVAKKMKKNSTILNIISTHYNKPRGTRLHYDISKAGVAMMTKAFALELADSNITVNALAIGATYTKMNYDFDTEKVLESTTKIPLKHICKPEEVAEYIYNIVNSFSKHSTGSIFTIDGGRNLV